MPTLTVSGFVCWPKQTEARRRQSNARRTRNKFFLIRFIFPIRRIIFKIFYRHFSVLIILKRSFFKKSFTTLIESSFGVAAKYKAPLKKCFVESVKKNWLAVAVLPASVKYIP